MTGNVNGLGDFKGRMIAFVSQQTGISADELKKMSVEELQELAKAKKAVSEELSASISSTKSMEEVDSSQFSLKEPKTAEQKDGWLKRQWDKLPRGAKIGLEVLGGAVAVGIVAAPILGGHGPALFEAAKGLAGAVNGTALAVGATAIGIGGLAVLSGCKKQPSNNVYIWQNVEIALGDLAAAIQEGNAIQQQILQELINHGHKLDKIITYLISHGQTLDDILGLLGDMNMQLGDIIHNQEELKPIVQDIQNKVNQITNLTVEQNDFLSQMLQTLMAIDANTQLTNEQIAEIKDLMNAILDMLDQIDEHNINAYTEFMQQLAQNNQLLQQIMTMLEQIDENNQAGFNQLLAQLIGIGGDIQELINAVNNNGVLLNLILEKLGSINNTLVEIKGFLNNILAEIINMHGDMNQNQAQTMEVMNQLLELLQDNNELLEGLNNTLQNWSQQQQAQFAQLMAQIMVMIENQNNANVTLEAILNAVQQAASQGNMNAQQIIALLTGMNSAIQNWQANQQQQFYDIMAQLMTIVGNQNDANVTLNAILDAVQNCSLTVDEILSILNDISNKMNSIQGQLQTMSAENRAFYQAILAKLNGMSLTQQQAYLDIIQRMINIENGQGEQNQQMQVIIDLIQNLNVGGGQVDIQPILDAIAGLGNNINNQGTALAALLSQILAKLDSINNKVSIIQTLAGNILTVAQSTNGVTQDILDILQQIAANMPCDTDECCENIIALLEEILDAILTGDWNHEGIVDDWGDILG